MSEASRVQTLLTEQNKELDRRSVALQACQEALRDVLGELREARDRIRTLEAALREIACDGDTCTCADERICSYGIARAALGEKKE